MGTTTCRFRIRRSSALGECKSNVDFFRELALRMGFDDECFRQPLDAMIDAALASGVPQLKGITRERLERDPHVRLNLNGDGNGKPWLTFANGFATPNGKARLYNEDLIALGMDPVVSFIPNEESRYNAADKRYPLELLARKADNFLNSTFVNLPAHQKMEPHQNELEISMEDAEPAGSSTAIVCESSTIAARSSCALVSKGRRVRQLLKRAAHCSTARRSRRSSRLGEAVAPRFQHQRSDLGSAYRFGRWCYVLLHSGGGGARRSNFQRQRGLA